MSNCKTPCPDCPFSKRVKPGALGGSQPEVYIGQTMGPFVIPCHKHIDYRDPQWREKSFETPQCAGAAVFRTHIGRAIYMPKQIHTLPPNPDVFADAAEFLAHHRQIPLEQARHLLSIRTPDDLFMEQIRRASNITKMVES